MKQYSIVVVSDEDKEQFVGGCYKATNAFHCPDKDKAMYMLPRIAKKFPGYEVHLMETTLISLSSATEPVLTKITEKGEVLPA